MKSKNKFITNFKNNFNNNKYINVIIITLIVVFSIYLLYFNDKIYVQDTIVNSLNNEDTNTIQDPVIENFDVNKYVDICKYRNTNFYNLGTTMTSTSSPNIQSCEKLCTDNSCHIFTYNDVTKACNRYTGILDSSNIDTRHAIRNLHPDPIRINCNSKVFNSSSSISSYGNYNGIGYMNKNYFGNNKTLLTYIDPYLEKGAEVLADLYNIENKRDNIRTLDRSSAIYDTCYNALLEKDKELFRKFDNLNRNYFDIPVDNSRNVLYTDMYNHSDISNTILAPIKRDVNFIKDVINKYNMVEKSDNLDGIIDSESANLIPTNLRYLILVFIMIITIIILILYKSSNFINEKILIAYIVIITFLVLFITHQLKL